MTTEYEEYEAYRDDEPTGAALQFIIDESDSGKLLEMGDHAVATSITLQYLAAQQSRAMYIDGKDRMGSETARIVPDESAYEPRMGFRKAEFDAIVEEKMELAAMFRNSVTNPDYLKDADAFFRDLATSVRAGKQFDMRQAMGLAKHLARYIKASDKDELDADKKTAYLVGFSLIPCFYDRHGDKSPDGGPRPVGSFALALCALESVEDAEVVDDDVAMSIFAFLQFHAYVIILARRISRVIRETSADRDVSGNPAWKAAKESLGLPDDITLKEIETFQSSAAVLLTHLRIVYHNVCLNDNIPDPGPMTTLVSGSVGIETFEQTQGYLKCIYYFGENETKVDKFADASLWKYLKFRDNASSIVYALLFYAKHPDDVPYAIPDVLLPQFMCLFRNAVEDSGMRLVFDISERICIRPVGSVAVEWNPPKETKTTTPAGAWSL